MERTDRIDCYVYTYLEYTSKLLKNIALGKKRKKSINFVEREYLRENHSV